MRNPEDREHMIDCSHCREMISTLWMEGSGKDMQQGSL